jgi:hypothetical protein
MFKYITNLFSKNANKKDDLESDIAHSDLKISESSLQETIDCKSDEETAKYK